MVLSPSSTEKRLRSSPFKRILGIFLGNQASDDPRPACVQGSRLRGATAWRAGVATSGRRSGFKGPEMIESARLRPVLRDGLVVGGSDLVADYPSPEAIRRQTCPAESFLTAGGLGLESCAPKSRRVVWAPA